MLLALVVSQWRMVGSCRTKPPPPTSARHQPRLDGRQAEDMAAPKPFVHAVYVAALAFEDGRREGSDELYLAWEGAAQT